MSSLFFTRQRRELGDVGQPLLPSRGRGLGRAVTWGSSLSIPAVWACAQLRADIVSTLPLDVYRKTSEPGALPQPLPTPPVLAKPSGDLSLNEWLFASQVSLDLRGNAYGVIVDRDRLGRPTQIELQHPDKVRVRQNEKGQIEYRINGSEVDTDDVWHERAFTPPGSVVGLSPIAVAAMTLGVSLSAGQFGASWFDDGAHPSAILRNKSERQVSNATAKVVKDRFMAAIRGGGREPVVIGGDWDYQQLQVNPNESQFLETMKFGVEEICRIFATPPEMVGASTSGSSLTYANREQRSLDYVAYRIGPVLARRENKLGELTGAGEYVKFNSGALLRTDLQTRYTAHKTAIDSKFMAPDEVRHIEDLPPLTPEQIAQIKQLGDGKQATAAEVLQKAYLAVGVAITADEARALANEAGAGLQIPGPTFPPHKPAVQPSPTGGDPA